jgi:hypothetical protein
MPDFFVHNSVVAFTCGFLCKVFGKNITIFLAPQLMNFRSLYPTSLPVIFLNLAAAVTHIFCLRNSTDLLIIINSSTKNPKSNKIKIKSLDHLATTTDTSVSRRHAAILTPPSPGPGKACRSRAYCSK